MYLTGTTLLAVVAAAIASFAFGAVYYTVLGKVWLAAVGKTEEEIKPNRSAVPFVVSFVGLLVMAAVLAAHHFGQYAAETGMAGQDAATAAGSAVLIWLAFVVTVMATNNAFQGNSFGLTVIDAGHWLGVLLIQELVISAF